MYRSYKTKNIHDGMRVHYTVPEEMSLQRLLGILSQTTVMTGVEPHQIVVSRGAHLSWDDVPTEEELARDAAWKEKNRQRAAETLERLARRVELYESTHGQNLTVPVGYYHGMAQAMLDELRRPQKEET
jgi:hypothetical protein